MRVFYELTHTSCDVEIMKSGFDFVVYHAAADGSTHWDESGRPKPKNAFMSPTIVKDCDVAVVGTENLLRKLPEGTPFIWKCLSDFGKHKFPKVALDRVKYFVFPCNETVARWGMEYDPRSQVIEHGIDANVFKDYRGETKRALTVVNLLHKRPERGPEVQYEVENHIPLDTMGFANNDVANDIGHSASMEHLAGTYRQYRLYFNPCTVVVCAVLEAMATGMPVVTMKPGNFKDLMKDGENCLIADSPQKAVYLIKKLFKDDHLCRRLGANARHSVYDRFNPAKTSEQWKDLIIKCFEESKNDKPLNIS
jgi:hypothetical protein